MEVLDQMGQLFWSKDVSHCGDHKAMDWHYAYINKKSKLHLKCMQVPCNLFEPLTHLQTVKISLMSYVPEDVWYAILT